MEEGRERVKQPKPRGRPRGTRKARAAPQGSLQEQGALREGSASYESALIEEPQEVLSEDERLSPFSNFLRHTLKRDRAEIARVAGALEISENTVYRWLNGHSVPRAIHLKHLLEVLPEHRRNLTYAINQTFPGMLDALASGDIREVQKDIYRRTLELMTTTIEDDARRWQITLSIFEYALLQLDSERQGIAITYAELMPPREDGIHSLYEAEMRGTSPWPFSQESKAYLGSTTLAGTAAMLQRMQTWTNLANDERQQFVIDEFERSACAYPVMRAGRIAGVLIVSSAQPDFFENTSVCQAVIEYAQLLSLGLKESDFYPCSLVRLRPMPDTRWQRREISHSFMNRVIAYARKQSLSRPEAEMQVRKEMEQEFEMMASSPLDQPCAEDEDTHRAVYLQLPRDL